ncbi:MAG TPA: hypothetical protein VGR56_05875 [Nitrososphaerales archaeon]|nr:hypothetical protein [Nitrososphaerales archaeon]
MANRRVALALVAVAAIWAIISLGAMTYGHLVNWPDFVHTNFGIPFTFATHTTSTITGPVDKWDMDTGALATDLAFWFTGMVAIVLAGLTRTLRDEVPVPMRVN